MRKLLFLAPLVLFASGCPFSPVERNAYNVIVGSKGFLDSIKGSHPECASPTATSTLCTDLHKAVAAKDVLIDAAEVYCAGPVFDNGGKCDAPAKGTPAAKVATDKLKAAIKSYNQTEADLRKVL